MELPARRTSGAPLAGPSAAADPALCRPSSTGSPPPPEEPPWWVSPAPLSAPTSGGEANQQESPWWTPGPAAAPAAPVAPPPAMPGRPGLPRGLLRRAVLGSAALLLICGAMVLLVERRPAESGQSPEPQTHASAASSATDRLSAEARIIRPEQPTEVDRPAPRLPRRLGGDIRRPQAAPDKAPPPAAEPVPARPPAEAKAPAAVARLIEGLADPDAAVRLRAAKQLGERGRAAHWAVPELSKALRDRVVDVGRQASKALAAVGAPAVPELIRALRERDVVVRARAAQSLALIGPEAREAVEGLTAALRDADPAVRVASIQALGEIGPAAKPGAPGLVRALSDGNDKVRGLAMLALRAIGPGAVESLGQTLAKGQPKERLAAVRALGLLGPDARGTLPQLREALRDSDTQVRAASAETLGRIGTQAREAIPELLNALRGKDLRTQVQAAITLVNLAPSVPGLLDKIRAVDRTGQWALPRARAGPRAVGPEELARLEKRLEDKDPQKRHRGVLGLAQRARSSPRAVKALIRALRHEDLQVRLGAARALTADHGPNLGADARRVRAEALRVLEEAEKVLAEARRGVQLIEKANLHLRREQLLRTLQDQDLQARLDRFVDLLIVVKTCSPPLPLDLKRPQADALERLTLHQALDTTLDNLGPAAIPALVRGINRLGILSASGMHFC